ncbi:MAG TPA: antitoxin [Microbacteriaceae bacterium]|nr:antitoxin [Microbacteriaceae bacterium]
MKLSVSLGESEVEYLDDLTSRGAFATRSAALAAAVRALRERELLPDYLEMFESDEYLIEAADWDITVRDGLPT